MSKFLSLLSAQQIDDSNESGRGTWKLLAPLVYQSDLLGRTLTVPAGFVTDFASVPRIPFVFDALGDRGNEAGALHDWAYTAPHPVKTRGIADSLLREALEAQGVSAWMAWQFYLGVRLGGRSHWQ